MDDRLSLPQHLLSSPRLPLLARIQQLDVPASADLSLAEQCRPLHINGPLHRRMRHRTFRQQFSHIVSECRSHETFE